MNLSKLLVYLTVLFIFIFQVACSSENEFESLEEWVADRQAQQLPGSEFIEKVATNDAYFAIFRKDSKVVLIQRVLTNESDLGGYSSNLSVDDAEGLNPNVVNPKTEIESFKFYKLHNRIYKEKTISLDINGDYEGKLHISYRWRPIVLDKEAKNSNASDAKVNNSIDPLVIDVETFWINSSI
ncbi:MAG: hypothetical protein GXP19_02470 [Gammaproteobacteria bacterium]|nr:hypothetical protein [Gammaproteobacteria bacterium]